MRPQPAYNTFCAGLLFSTDNTEMVLAKKHNQQLDKVVLNPVGGRLIDGETPERAMCRIFQEITGLGWGLWERFAIITGKNWRAFYFVGFCDDISEVRTVTDDQVEVHPVAGLQLLETATNLQWLVPLALDTTTKLIRGTV